MPRIVPVKPIFSEKQILTHFQELIGSINILDPILIHENDKTSSNLAQYGWISYQEIFKLKFLKLILQISFLWKDISKNIQNGFFTYLVSISVKNFITS